MDWPPLPDYGCIPRWPQDGQGFIHPDDVPVATRCFPSERVFRRDRFDGVYYHYSYGSLRFRLRPSMWLKVISDGIDIGDRVETVGASLERELSSLRCGACTSFKARVAFCIGCDGVTPMSPDSTQPRICGSCKTNRRCGLVTPFIRHRSGVATETCLRTSNCSKLTSKLIVRVGKLFHK